MQVVRWGYGSMGKAVDKWVLGGAEADPNFLPFFVKDVVHSVQHTTAYDV